MLSAQTANLSNPNLFAFTPRQVLLANSQMKKNYQSDVSTMASSPLPLNGAIGEPTGLSNEHKTLLLHSVALFLERNGFSKTLKKFMSEALIGKDSLKDALLDLEEMCIKYLKIRDHGKPDSNSQKEQAMMPEPGRKHKDKSKRKSKLVSESLLDNVKEQELKSLEGEPLKKSDPLLLENEPKKKSKDKKSQKKKVQSEVSVDDSEHCGVEKENKDSKDLKDLGSSKDPEKKSKNKKDDELNPNIKDSEINDSRCNGSDLKKDGLDASCVNDGEKRSKKRKKSQSDGHDSKHIDEESAEGIKRRKVEVLEECLENEQHSQMNESLKSCSNTGKESKGESDPLSSKESQKVPVNQVEAKEKGSKSLKKAMKINDYDSSEPKTKNAFQRVKVDEVAFTDRRLQDNSYWAKGGADTGYGAKAQEVLGQVRGRDFRHEKTKKKRGSYRGGLIDLESHSVKFSYSEDDE